MTLKKRIPKSGSTANTIQHEKSVKETPSTKSRPPSSNFTPYVVALVLVLTSMTLLSNWSDIVFPPRSKSSLSGALHGNETEPLVPRYESDFVNMNPEKLLSEKKLCEGFEPKVVKKSISVQDAMSRKKAVTSEIFVMLNGGNVGMYVTWNEAQSCLYASIALAAKELGMDEAYIRTGLQLFTQNGHTITKADEVKAANNIVHVLWSQQLWMYAGVEVGYVYELEKGWTLTTLSLRPLSFRLDNFLEEADAEEIVRQGKARLQPQRASDGVGKSNSGFLKESHLTRKYSRNAAQLVRLPSPSFAERLKLVRYEDTEFFSQHVDNFHKDFVDPLEPGVRLDFPDFVAWCEWASTQLEHLRDEAPESLPNEFHSAKSSDTLVPDADNAQFVKNVLRLLCDYGESIELFDAFHDDSLREWIMYATKKGSKETFIMEKLLEPGNEKSWILIFLIEAWEAKLGHVELKYRIPTKATNSVTFYFNWIRSMKETIAERDNKVPEDIHPSQLENLHPRYTMAFQVTLLRLVWDHFGSKALKRELGPELYTWLEQSREGQDVVVYLLQVRPSFLQWLITAYESAITKNVFHYKLPNGPIPHFEPQRFATIVLYLTHVEEGGETMFPFHYNQSEADNMVHQKGNKKRSRKSKAKGKAGQVDIMEACKKGLKVSPIKLSAVLFYVQTPEMEVDFWAEHGGCKVTEGTKWSANIFMWNVDSAEGGSAYAGGKRDFQPGDRFYAFIR